MPVPFLRYRAALAAFAAMSLTPAQAARAQAVPDARAHHQLVYHAGDARTYLIGGSTRRGEGHHYFDDVWSWDGTVWTQADALPFPRSSHRVVYHAQRNSLVLFGGGFAQAIRAEGVIWERRAGVWKAIGGNSGAGADEPGMCYDRRRERVVMFGGWDARGNFRGEIWEWGPSVLRVSTARGPDHAPVMRFCMIQCECAASCSGVRARAATMRIRGSGTASAGVSWRCEGHRLAGLSDLQRIR